MPEDDLFQSMANVRRLGDALFLVADLDVRFYESDNVGFVNFGAIRLELESHGLTTEKSDEPRKHLRVCGERSCLGPPCTRRRVRHMPLQSISPQSHAAPLERR